MARPFNPVQLQILYTQAAVTTPVAHGDIILVRLSSGPWGIGDRYARLTIDLQNQQGQPLQQPVYRALPGPVNIHTDIMIEGPLNIVTHALPDLEYLPGVHRHGPLHDGLLQPGDGYGEGFLPITEQELAQVQNPADLRQEIRLLREIWGRRNAVPANLPLRIGQQGGGEQIIPINHIRGVIGQTPTDAKKVALWLGKGAPAIEGIFPIADAAIRARVVNALVSNHPNLAITPEDAIDWDTVLATLYQRAHGAAARHELPKLLTEIAKEEGVLIAFRMGMMFSQRDFELVWGIIRQSLPGQAIVTNAQQQLDLLPDDHVRAQQLPVIIRGLYQLLGLDNLGKSTRTPSIILQKNPPKNNSNNNNGNRGRGRNRGQPSGTQPSRRDVPNIRPNERPPNGPNGNANNYNFRRNPQTPNWFSRGGGRNPYRGPTRQDNREEERRTSEPQRSSEPQPTPQESGERSGGRRGGRGSPRVIHAIRTPTPAQNNDANGSATEGGAGTS